MQVTLVPSDHVDEVWEAVAPCLERAAEYTYGRYTVDDIRDTIRDYDHDLWMAFDDNGTVFGAVVTTFKHYPRMLALDLVFVGGHEGMTWKDVMLKTLQSFAFDSKCDVIESSGRLGWSKIFKSDGYKPLWQTYELPVGTSGIGG